MGNYMKIFLLITIFTYVAEASGYTQSKYADSAVYWIQPMLLSTSESRSRPIFSDEMKFRNVESRGKGGGGKGGPKGQQKLPGAGFQMPPGFDGKRVCANAYFTKNMIYSMIQTLEYQKQMAMMLQVMVEGGQLTSAASAGGAGVSPEGSATTSSTEPTTTESTTASTTESTTLSTTESTTTTTTTTTTPAPTSPTTANPDQPTISPQAVQDLLNLLTDILTILPDLLAQFAALEESVNGGGSAAPVADEVITPEMQAYEVTDDKQEAIDRLTMLEATLKDKDLSSYTRKLAHSRDLVIRILEQTMQDITVLAPTDLRVQSFVEEFDYLARSHRWK